MYKILIDYSGKLKIEKHWYGNFDNIILPNLPNSNRTFYNVVSLSIKDLPLKLPVSLERIYLPHYFDSDLIMEDLFFSYKGNEIILLNKFNQGLFNIYDDFVNHTPKSISFRQLQDFENPCSSKFDEDLIERPYHQLGGCPFFVQQDGHSLKCVRCFNEMSFLLQFGNDQRLNAEFDDGGIAYYWLCYKCEIIGCRIESY